ncbi:MAG TPA: DUF3108 domain-containing protein [Prolixibacteraceae bacterium]|nr:DUF3108 domain-containing protein [Prolixibacteraceae bacterium]
MRVCLYFTVILLLMNFHVHAQEIMTTPIKPNTAFKAGENLTYQIRYGFIVAGITTLSLNDEIYNNKKIFHARTLAQTTGLADKLYGVKDIYESWFDKSNNLPYRQIRNISEGHYRKYNEVTYNRESNTVNSTLSGVHQVPELILDLSSAFYYIRRVDFSNVKEGDVLFVNMYFSDEIFPFRFIYRGKETIRTKFGKINCHKVCPVVEVGRMFKNEDDLSVWFTDDDNCLPVLVKMDIRVVGSVLLKLVEYKNIANPLVFDN